MSGTELLHWWNLVFLVPGAVGTMLGLMAMIGVGGHGVARSRVEVDAAQVAVEKQRVEVEAQALANREKYGRAAIEFELGKLRIQASKDTQVAAAQALGQFLAKANFTLFGDPESARRVLEGFVKGMGLGRTIEGFLAGTDEETKEALKRATSTLMSSVEGVVDRVTGRGKPADKAGKAEKAEPEEVE
jgi:hypothetical protein